MSASRILHVRINDATTGQPVPVRVRFTDAEGRYLAPLGRLSRFAITPYQDVGGNLLLDGREYAYIDGTCEIAVPPGPLTVEVSRGPEYMPWRRELSLGAGQMAMRLTIERWCDLRQEGWFSGDGRAHALSPHAALLGAAAEDLAVVNLLVTEYQLPDGTPAISNITAFSGQRPALKTPGHVVVVNTLNRHAQLGKLALLHCHRVVYPLSLGRPYDPPDWSLADWCDQCHRKRGLVVWAGFAPPHEATVASLVPGRLDAIELCPQDDWRPSIEAWYRLLNHGWRLPLVGSSGKDSNNIALGALRTYARLEAREETSPVDYRAWIEAVRVGRTFITTGPLIAFRVNDHGPGAVVTTPATVHIQAEARSAHGFQRLEVLHNGAVIAIADSEGSTAVARIETDLVLDQSGWLAARCHSAATFAHTSPVYIGPAS